MYLITPYISITKLLSDSSFIIKIYNTFRALDQFKNVDGKKLLSLKRDELISAFGKVEGSRLDGQLQISRKTTGYGTASSELRNVLAKAKKRADEERRESIRQAYTDNDFQSAA